jgi:putative membrane protein
MAPAVSTFISDFGQIVKIAWITIFFAVLLWSAIGPKDFPTWALEVAPAVIGFVILAATYNSFRLTGILYALILLHCIILMVGGHYTYAEVPLFDYLKPVFGFERNNYDKLGHLAQGFVPAMIAREILIRKMVVSSAAWRNFLIICVCLALSAFYELIEWWVAILSETAAEAFLGTQGYVWDTQSDMAFALIGTVLALLLFGRAHDRQLRELSGEPRGRSG